MKHALACLVFVLAPWTWAQTLDPQPTANEPASQTPQETEPTVVPAPKDLPTSALRGLSQYSVNAHLSPISTWLPMKYGLSLGYISSQTWTFEAELTRKSISAKVLDVDFGQVVDQRYGVQARWYPSSNTFNLIMGLFKSEFSFELGNSYLNNIPGSPSATVWKFESIGPQLGLSNRAQWSNGITFGIDWFVIYIPMLNKTIDDEALQSVTNSDDRDNLDKATKAIRNIPQFDLLRITLGYTF